ncbi:MAG TPA: ATP-binding protein [Humisphaera sp.]
MRSIRGRLTLWLVGATLVLCGAAAAACYARVSAALIAEFDRDLEARARSLSSLVQQEPDGTLEITPADVNAPTFAAGSAHPEYLQIWDAGGRTLLRSASLGGSDISPPAAGGAVHVWDVTLPDGRAGRAVSFRFAPFVEPDTEPHESGSRTAAMATATTKPAAAATGPMPPSGARMQLTIALLRDTAPVHRIQRAVLGAVAAATALLCVALLVVVPLVVRAGLVDVRRLAEQARRIDAGSLAERFPTDGLPVELQPICERLNDLLGRLQGAFARERRFTASVAHEMRTPIAELRALSDVALRWPPDAATAAIGFRDVLGIAQRMQAVVAALLSLCRSDAGRVATGAVEAGSVVRAGWEARRQDAADRGVCATLDLPAGPLLVDSDPSLLRTMVDNLLANAAEYCPAGGRVDVSVRVSGDAAELVVSNPAGSLAATDVPLLAEPFWRKDAAGTTAAHAGLGLSLVVAYARLLGIDVAFDVTPSGDFQARLRLPLSQADRTATTSPAVPVRPTNAVPGGGV